MPVRNGTPDPDALDAGELGETLFGFGGADTLTGTLTPGTLVGGGNDCFDGGEGDDQLAGGAGDDTLVGGPGADLLDGGEGNDVASYALSGVGVRVDLGFRQGAGQGEGIVVAFGDAEGDVLFGIETVIGSAFADTLTAGFGGVLFGGAGDDDLAAGPAGGTLLGEEGDDRLQGGFGSDSLAGGAGNDTLLDDAGFDTLRGGEGDDSLDAGFGNDLLDGGAGNDTLVGDGSDRLAGGAGADSLVGGIADYAASAAAVRVDLASGTGAGGDAEGDRLLDLVGLVGSRFADTLLGGLRADSIAGGAGGDSLAGGAEWDTLSGGRGQDSLAGGDDEDRLEGGLGNDRLDGDAGADTLAGGGGADTLDGGAGLDVADYGAARLGVVLDLDSGLGSGGEAAGDRLAGIEIVVGSGRGDRIAGSGMGETLLGQGGGDSLDGGGGDDLIVGGAGRDSLAGGAGQDTLSYAEAAGGVRVDLGLGRGSGGEASGDLVGGFEVVLGGFGDDHLAGDAAANLLVGGSGADTLRGAAGADTLDSGGDGSDVASYAGDTVGVVVDLGAGLARGGDAEGDLLVGFRALLGGSGADTLAGAEGAETLMGRLGDDLLRGGLGADLLRGSWGRDSADYSASAAAVTVSGGAIADINVIGGVVYPNFIYAVGGDAEGDTLLGIENLIGSAGDDLLGGDGAANALSGGGGADTLVGGVGADTLDGGDGLDLADYAASGSGVRVTLSTGLAAGGTARSDRLFGIEWLRGSALDDTLTGSLASETLDGGAGNDVLRGGAAGDLLRGGGGELDVASYAGSTAVAVDLGAGTQAGGDAAGDTLVGIRGAIGGDGDDSLRGDVFANLLAGGNGADTLVAVQGSDTLQGGAGVDLADFSASFDAVRVSLRTGTGDGGDAFLTVLSGVEWLRGSAWDDLLEGDAAANRLEGGGGADTLGGGAGGADSLDGGDGRDLAAWDGRGAAVQASLATGLLGGDGMISGIEDLRGGLGGDTLEGDGAGNALDGTAGDDSLIGGGGEDLLVGGAGRDSMQGGDGLDTASYLGAGGAVVAGLEAGGVAGEAEGDTYLGIERLQGSGFGDSLAGGGDGDILVGEGGDDSLAGGGGDDSLAGASGNDVMAGGAGADTMLGQDGRDAVSYAASGAAVRVYLGSFPADVLAIGGDATGDILLGIEDLVGSAHDDTLRGLGDDNAFQGGEGDDVLLGEGGADTLQGGAGADTLQGNEGADLLEGGEGRDRVDYSWQGTGQVIDLGATGATGDGDTLTGIEDAYGTAQADTIQGGATAGWLAGGGGDDSITGLDADGQDTLAGGAGADTLRGTGRSIASFEDAAAPVLVDLGASLVGGDAATDVLIGIGGVIGSAGADTLVGDATDNLLAGGAGHDLLRGGEGADTLEGGPGRDTLRGEGGEDWASYRNSANGVLVALWLGTGVNSVDAEETGDQLVGIGNLAGSALADTLDGDENANRLRGEAGDDLLRGRQGDDVLAGGAGADTLDGGTGRDVASHAWATAGVVARLDGGAGAGDGAGDAYVSIEDLEGSAFADTLVGDGDGNRLSGGEGADSLAGGAGADTLEGGAGADSLDGGEGRDIASYASAAVGVAVTLGGAGAANAEGDVLSGIEGLIGSALADTLIGDGGANSLVGGMGADRLEGGEGDDLLIGGPGGDALLGGGGQDTASWADVDVSVVANLATRDVLVGGVFGRVTSIEGLVGGSAADTLTGNAGANRLEGGEGDDLLLGGLGGDALLGGAGQDTASWADVGVSVVGDIATRIVLVGGVFGLLTAVEALVGGSAADTLAGDSAANLLAGSAGDDRLEGKAGADTLDGGEGFDMARHAGAASGVAVSLATGTGTAGDAAGDVLTGIEGLEGSALADTLAGNDGANRLEGGDGNDLLAGGLGGDTLVGAAGQDTASWAGIGLTVVGDLATGQIRVGGVLNLATAVEGLVGGSLADTLQGAASNDRLEGGAGDDSLAGRDGDDTLAAGEGADTLAGGAGHDVVTYAGASGPVAVLADVDPLRNDLNSPSLIQISLLTNTALSDYLAQALPPLSGDRIFLTFSDRILWLTGEIAFVLRFGPGGSGVPATANQGSAGGAAGDVIGADVEAIIGSDFGDTLASWAQTQIGGAGDDVVSGYRVGGLVQGGAGADTLTAVAHGITLSYEGSAQGVRVDLARSVQSGGDAQGDVVVASSLGIERSVRLVGTASNDLLAANGADNTLVGGAGGDVLVGRGGFDMVDYAASDAAVRVRLAAPETVQGDARVDASLWIQSRSILGLDDGFAAAIGIGGHAAGDVLIGVEGLRGGAFDDLLAGDDRNNRLEGAGGADTLIAGQAETISDADVLSVALPLDYLLGGAGNDLLDDSAKGASAPIVLNGFEGISLALFFTSLLSGGAGADTIIGGDRSAVSYGDAAAGIVLDRADPSRAAGDASGDVLLGVNRFIGSSHDDEIRGGSAAEVILGFGGSDTLAGGGGDDLLVNGDLQVLSLYGTLGRTVYRPGLVEGGDGNDVLFLGGGGTGRGGADDDLLVGMGGNGSPYDVLGTRSFLGALVLEGGEGADTLNGSGDALLLSGGSGADVVLYLGSVGTSVTLMGGAGADTITSPGSVTLSYADATGTVAFSIADPALRLGDAGEDAISVAGVAGLIGSAFADTLVGSAADETIEGGAGADSLVGGEGRDVLSFAGAAAGLVFDATGAILRTGDAAGDRVSGFEAVLGSAFADTLVGFAEITRLDGGAGDDRLIALVGGSTLAGGEGNDLVVGSGLDDVIILGPGADTAVGGSGYDVLVLPGATALTAADIVTVDLLDPAATVGPWAGTVFNGFEEVRGSGQRERIAGSDDDDLLSGGGNGDTLVGRGGDDTLVGGLGGDRMTGGAGADVFRWNAAGEIGGLSMPTVSAEELVPGSVPPGFGSFLGKWTYRPDQVTDFVSGEDLLDLSAVFGSQAQAATRFLVLDGDPRFRQPFVDVTDPTTAFFQFLLSLDGDPPDSLDDLTPEQQALFADFVASLSGGADYSTADYQAIWFEDAASLVVVHGVATTSGFATVPFRPMNLITFEPGTTLVESDILWG